jgi:nucleoside-diphosphate-sugar epimerase
MPESAARDLCGASVLITGAAGFIGRRLSRRLVGLGAEVVGVDIAEWADFPGRRWLQKDVSALTAADLGAMPIDIVFHLPALVGVAAAASDGARTTASILAPLERMLELSPVVRTGAFVFVSSSEVYGEGGRRLLEESAELRPLSAYGQAKAAAEGRVREWCASSEIPGAIIRPFNVYGPGQRSEFVVSAFARSAVRGIDLELVGDGAQTRTPTFVDDFLTGLIAASALAGPDCPVYNIAGTETVTIRQLADEVIRQTGSSLDIRSVDPEELGRPRSIEIRFREPARDRARAALGFVAKVPLSEGIARVIEYERSVLDSVPVSRSKVEAYRG